MKTVPSFADGWYAHQCFDLKACLENFYDERELHELKFRRLQFGRRDDFWVDEFSLIDISRAGLRDFEGQYEWQSLRSFNQ